jgi:glutaredoxin
MTAYAAGRRRRTPWPILAIALMLGACADERDDGTTPQPSETLPPLNLRADSGELLLTWIDDHGGTHTEVSVAAVPVEGRELVRVVTKDAGHGGLFYVADLRSPGGDGSYPVRTMTRSEWEALIEKRREAYRAKHAPPPPEPRGASTGADPGTELPDARVRAVVYGADWCKPCHDAARYLRKKGVEVIEHDIEKEPRYASEMQKKLRDAGMGGGSIPVVDVGGTILRGFNPGAIDRAIAKAQKRGTRL